MMIMIMTIVGEADGDPLADFGLLVAARPG